MFPSKIYKILPITVLRASNSIRIYIKLAHTYPIFRHAHLSFHILNIHGFRYRSIDHHRLFGGFHICKVMCQLLFIFYSIRIVPAYQLLRFASPASILPELIPRLLRLSSPRSFRHPLGSSDSDSSDAALPAQRLKGTFIFYVLDESAYLCKIVHKS